MYTMHWYVPYSLDLTRNNIHAPHLAQCVAGGENVNANLYTFA